MFSFFRQDCLPDFWIKILTSDGIVFEENVLCRHLCIYFLKFKHKQSRIGAKPFISMVIITGGILTSFLFNDWENEVYKDKILLWNHKYKKKRKPLEPTL